MIRERDETARTRVAAAGIAICWMLLAGSAQAGEFYGSLGLAITGVHVDATGDNGVPLSSPNGGDPTDTSPLIAGAVGFEFRMHELLPRSGRAPAWMPDVDLEDWVLRTELEAAGARSYDLTVKNGSQFRHVATVEDVTLMLNQWLDLPLGHAIEAVAGRVRGIDDLTLNLGLGIGYKYSLTEVANGVSFGEQTEHGMAWQAGTELGYSLSDNIVLTGGYRYVGLGVHRVSMTDSSGAQNNGHLKLGLNSHEFRAGLRVSFYAVRFPRGLLEPKRRYEP